jgi:hypothetical protein
MPKVYCIADALDEMETGNEKFIRQLLNLGFRKPESIKVLMTSRLLARVQNYLKDPAPSSIRLDRPFVNQDIAFYARSRLVESQISIDQRDAVMNIVCDKSNGLFLYARLMLDDVLGRPDRSAIKEKLDKLPDSLGDMYTCILLEHSKRSKVPQSLQLLILQWVTHSTRPLRLIELASVIRCAPEYTGMEAREAKNLIRMACGPLLEILEDETVQVLHHSFTEFLLAIDAEPRFISSNSNRFPRINTLTAHRMIAKVCLEYLLNGCFRSWEVRAKEDFDMYSGGRRLHHKTQLLEYPLLQYAGKNWPAHVTKCGLLDFALIRLLDELLSPDQCDFAAWKDFY